MNKKSTDYNPMIEASDFSKIPHDMFVQEKGIDLLTQVATHVLIRTPHNLHKQEDIVGYAFDLATVFLDERAKRLKIKKGNDGK